MADRVVTELYRGQIAEKNDLRAKIVLVIALDLIFELEKHLKKSWHRAVPARYFLF